MEKKELTNEEKHILIDKGTEPPFSGAYCSHFEQGIYLCRQCSAPLYRSEDKFDSRCGWPSFDDELPGAVDRTLDADGRRTEITCSSCGGHLGHVFSGEGYTEKDTRHCVNSLSLEFVPAQRAVFASGCFWGPQYFFDRAEGVLLTRAGYTGGETEHPTYREVCTGRTGHVEAVEVLYDPKAVSFEQLAKLFFETHDPSQEDGQGPDIGEQYRSVLFYSNEQELSIARSLVKTLEKNKIPVATRIEPLGTFWPAEQYHQHWYDQKGTPPSCHWYTKRF